MTHTKTTSRRNRVKLACLYCVSLALAGGVPFSPAMSDVYLRDPTRPPTLVFTPQERDTVNVGPVLQSISFASGRRTAIISGQPVKPGSKVGEAQVVSINETEVVLRTGNGLQTLKLFPDVEKHSITKIKRPQALRSRE